MSKGAQIGIIVTLAVVVIIGLVLLVIKAKKPGSTGILSNLFKKPATAPPPPAPAQQHPTQPNNPSQPGPYLPPLSGSPGQQYNPYLQQSNNSATANSLQNIALFGAVGSFLGNLTDNIFGSSGDSVDSTGTGNYTFTATDGASPDYTDPNYQDPINGASTAVNDQNSNPMYDQYQNDWNYNLDQGATDNLGMDGNISQDELLFSQTA